MNIGRAKEILMSADPIKVSYEGESVIIQYVDERTRTARIYSRAEPEKELDVSVLNLIEG